MSAGEVDKAMVTKSTLARAFSSSVQSHIRLLTNGSDDLALEQHTASLTPTADWTVVASESFGWSSSRPLLALVSSLPLACGRACH